MKKTRDLETLKESLTNKILTITARNPGWEELLALTLGVQVEYNNWKQDLQQRNLHLDVQWILTTWEERQDPAQDNPELLLKTLVTAYNMGRKDYKSLIDILKVRLLINIYYISWITK